MPPISDEKPLKLFNTPIKSFIQRMESDEFGITTHDVNMFPVEESKVTNYSRPNLSLKFDLISVFVRFYTNYLII